MRPDHGAVDDGTGLIDLDLQVAKDGSKVTLACPIREAVVHAFPGAKALGQVTPGKARLGPVQDGVDEQAVAADGVWSTSLWRKHSLQASPLLVAERVAMHSCFSSRLAGGRKKSTAIPSSGQGVDPSWGQARRAGGRERSRRDVRRCSASLASGCQPEPEEVMAAPSAAVDFRSRRGRPGASPQKPSAAFSYGPFHTQRTRDSP